MFILELKGLNSFQFRRNKIEIFIPLCAGAMSLYSLNAPGE